MKNLLSSTTLACAIVFAAAAGANDTKSEPPSAAVKASYSLPKQDGAQFRQTLQEADEENAQLKQQVVADHADLYDLLTAPEFDSNAFQAKMEDLRKQQDIMKSNRDDAFIAAVKQLTPKERQQLAQGLEANEKYTAHHHRKMASNGTATQNAAPSAGNNTATQ